MNTYQVWLMPQDTREKGSFDKWSEHEIVEAENRKSVASKYTQNYKSGSWKIRLYNK